MSDEAPMSEPVAETSRPRKKGGGFKKLLFILLPVLALLGGGAWFFLNGSSGAVQAEETKEAKIEERGIVPFETFLVNLTDPGGNRFLKCTLQLVFASEAEAKHVADNEALMGHARSAMLELLAEQNATALITAEGKQKLKDAVKTHVAKILAKYKVVDVLFSEFVVQF
jgi:flagellar FliL protein